ncbi:MAG: hypothetical protein HYZ89_03690 [Candidatus Omnitrophica bacterium]|nr:hypothetical protein [Candidatus Omnitrophota bacterium]
MAPAYVFLASIQLERLYVDAQYHRIRLTAGMVQTVMRPAVWAVSLLVMLALLRRMSWSRITVLVGGYLCAAIAVALLIEAYLSKLLGSHVVAFFCLSLGIWAYVVIRFFHDPRIRSLFLNEGGNA